MTVPYQATLQVRDTCMCLHVQRTARMLARHFDVALRPAGMTNEQFSLLMSLNRPVAPTMGEVARLLGADRTTLTAALKPLLRDALADIAVDAADRRVRRVALTRQGHERLARAIPLWEEAHRRIETQAAPLDMDAVRASMVELAGAASATAVDHGAAG